MDVGRDDVCYFPLKVVWYGAYHAKSTSLISRFRFIIGVLFLVLYLVLAVIGLFTYTDLNFFLECIQTIILMIHSIGKAITLEFTRPIVLKLFKDVEGFWGFNNNKFPEENINYERFLSIGRSVVNGYLLSGLILGMLFAVQPFASGRSPSAMYVPPGLDDFINLSFIYMAFIIYCGNLGLDTLFSSLCVKVSAQFKLLQYEFKNINFSTIDYSNQEKFWDDLGRLVKHHNFLINFCSILNEMAHFAIILQFTITILGGCLQLFITFHGDLLLMNEVKCGVYFLVTVIQAGMYYCFGEMVSETSSDIADAIYNANWYECQISKIPKCIPLIIARGQKIVVISGYGLVIANLQTFTLVLKTALTYYTYLTTMEEK